MDSIDECRIDCEFVKSNKKRELLEQRFENLYVYKKKICDSLNYVCSSKVKYSCLQCYNKVTDSYISNECRSSCDDKRVRYSYCFKLDKEFILNIIAEKGDNTVIITFYPFPVADIGTLRKKCDDIINNLIE
ncbi:hypothetical protein [Saccharolobus caldissimus]|uniref:Uncharacterized protein n=1 Tax=Saccharolobus caldissimus TaxID=1702097 RepID=A0AAQ4CSD2_9CREN|nr:hypothetical protein [Saccharolobus caldissimus]BDB98713.1 hypothetical protein SACC_17300 [Saccharolobus caldissimus]